MLGCHVLGHRVIVGVTAGNRVRGAKQGQVYIATPFLSFFLLVYLLISFTRSRNHHLSLNRIPAFPRSPIYNADISRGITRADWKGLVVGGSNVDRCELRQAK